MCNSGEFGINSGMRRIDRVHTTGYIVSADGRTRMPEADIFPSIPNSVVQDIVDKDGVVRKGVFVTDANTPKVNKAKVTAFIAKVKNAVSDDVYLTKLLANLEVSDIMSSSGVLNPDFTLNDKGEIVFKNKEKYFEKLEQNAGEDKEYFETSTGQWARDPNYKPDSGTRELTWGNILREYFDE